MKRKTFLKRFVLSLLVTVTLVNMLAFNSFAVVYSDTSSHWAKTAIDKMTDLEIIKNIAPLYYPNNNYTRKEVAYSICMMFKERNLPSSPQPFSDVSTSNSYSKYIKWVYEANVMSGTGSNNFSPDAVITKQDLCVALYKLYANRLGIPIYYYNAKVTFSDDAQISSYAKTAVYALQQMGVISGNGGAFNPKSNVTRAIAASMFYELWDYGFILSTPQQLQQQSMWCWAASSYIIAKYRHDDSRSMIELVNHFITGTDKNKGKDFDEIPEVVDYATKNNYQHDISYKSDNNNTQYHNNIISNISNYKPIIILVSGNNGHAMVLLGYIKHPTNINNSKFFIYDVWDGEYKWEYYSDLLDGTMKIDERAICAYVYSL